MDLKEVMCQQVFVVVGDTLNPDKYACKIKNALLQNRAFSLFYMESKFD